MFQEKLSWVVGAFNRLVKDQDIPKMQVKEPHGGYISIYRVGDVIRIDVKSEETKRKG